MGNLIFIDGNMTGKSYRESLENNLLKYVEKLSMSHEWIFQHHNDPKHRAATVANWLNRNVLKRLHWPSFSSDLNTCEMKSKGGLRKSNLKVKTS